MGWPKGVPRKGYVNKDGTPHAAKGRRVKRKADPIVVVKPYAIVVSTKVHEAVLHGMSGNGAISEPCPRCGYAYADGGYCQDCGWSRPIRLDTYGTNSGGKR